MNRLVTISLTVVLLLTTLIVGGGGAQARSVPGQTQSGISVSATAGYGDSGAYLIGEWIPVRVMLNNPAGGQSMRVRVEVDSWGPNDGSVAGIYGREVDLPSPSRKEVTLYAFTGTFTRNFRVRVVEGSTTLTSVLAAADPYEPPQTMLVGVVSSDASFLNFLNGEQVGHIVNPLPPGGYGASYGGVYFSGPYGTGSGSPGSAVVAHMNLEDIPTLSPALDSLGVLVLDDADTASLTPDQQSALRSWVARGGTLVTTYRPGGPDLAGPIADLMPVTVQGSRNVTSLQALSGLVGLPALSDGASVGNATLRTEPEVGAHALAQQDGVPLVAARDLGLGHVIYLGLSPAVAPLRNWDGTLPLVKRLLSDHELRLSYGAFLRFSPSRGYVGPLFQSFGGMFALPGLDLPDPWLVGFFLLIYIVVIGPLNFIILRRMRRAELAWLTTPALVVIFSVIAYLLAFQAKGGDLVSIRANIVNTVPGIEEATALQHFGLFSPIRRTYSISLPAESAVTEMNSYGYRAGTDSPAPVLGGDTTTINNVNINTWSLKGYVAEHTITAQMPLDVQLHLADNMIEGTVTNRSNQPLQDVALLRGDALQHIGYIAPGSSADVRLQVSSALFNNASPVNILPAPPGVTAPGPGMGYPYNDNNNAEQRTYNRKIEMLSAGLYPYVSDRPPIDLRVTVLAWGPGLPTAFSVDGYSTSTDEVNLWTGTFDVRSDNSDKSRLDTGSVPYSIYAPGNSPAWLPWNGVNPISVVVVPTGPMPTTMPGVIPTPTAFYPGPSTQPPPGLRLDPYADLRYRLPAGTSPDTLKFQYSISTVTSDAGVNVLAYNVNTGSWDALQAWPETAPSNAGGVSGEVPIQDPGRYVAPGGQVTLRLWSNSGGASLADVKFELSLNQ